MTHTITAFPNGKWKQNCYIVSDDDTGQALLIDPGSQAQEIQDLISLRAHTPVAILNTHAHYDHIGAVAALMAQYAIPFYLHRGDDKLLKQANLYKILFESKAPVTIPQATHDLSQLAVPAQIGGFKVSVLFTPGHTQGSTCLQIGADLFSGDTLLPGGPGRTDLPGGDKKMLTASVNSLRNLPGTITVRPGHGRPFALASLWEKLSRDGATT
jgi:glyoxylase-like metal-dependent hydrolase (beta-lactamase superfamily II)